MKSINMTMQPVITATDTVLDISSELNDRLVSVDTSLQGLANSSKTRGRTASWRSELTEAVVEFKELAYAAICQADPTGAGTDWQGIGGVYIKPYTPGIIMRLEECLKERGIKVLAV